MGEEQNPTPTPVAQAAPAVQAPSPVVASPMPSSSAPKKSNMGLLIGIVVVVLLLLGGGGLLAFAFFSNKDIPVLSSVAEQVSKVVVSKDTFAEAVQDDMTDLLFRTAKDVTDTAVQNDVMTEDQLSEASFEDYIKTNTEVNSYKEQGSVEVQVSVPAQEDTPAMDFTVTLDVDGSYLKTEDGMSMDANLTGAYTAEGTSFNFDGDFRLINDELFLKLNTIPALGFDLEDYKGKWYFLDISENSDLASSVVEAQETEVSLDEKITNEDLDKLSQLVQGDTIKNSIERLPEEVHDGVRTNCFAMDMTGEDLANLVKEAEVLWDVAEEDKLTDEDVTEMKDMIKSLTLEACAGKQDKLLYRLDFTVEIESEGTNVVITTKTTTTDYNSEDIQIEKPEGAEDFIEAMGTLFATDTPVDNSVLSYEEFADLYGEGYTEEELEAYYQQYLEYMQ